MRSTKDVRRNKRRQKYAFSSLNTPSCRIVSRIYTKNQTISHYTASVNNIYKGIIDAESEDGYFHAYDVSMASGSVKGVFKDGCGASSPARHSLKSWSYSSSSLPKC